MPLPAQNPVEVLPGADRKSTRLNSSHTVISYAVFCLKTEEKTSELQSHSDVVCRLLLGRTSLRVGRVDHDVAGTHARAEREQRGRCYQVAVLSTGRAT